MTGKLVFCISSKSYSDSQKSTAIYFYQNDMIIGYLIFNV